MFQEPRLTLSLCRFPIVPGHVGCDGHYVPRPNYNRFCLLGRSQGEFSRAASNNLHPLNICSPVSSITQEPFTIKEALAGLIAFVGVLFIARPTFLFPSHDDARALSSYQVGLRGGLLPPPSVTPAERSIAIICAVFGSFAAATAYATIRVIGKRTHSLVSVNYFATIATVSSFLIIMVHPDLKFQIPQSPAQWSVIFSLLYGRTETTWGA